MICAYPISAKTQTFSCGQCMPCRINKRRIWTARCLLEAMFHPSSMFVTLTYSDTFVPRGTFHTELRKDELQNFQKRFREYLAPRRIRFFAVGEYGTKTMRPHYHAIVFNAQGESVFLNGDIKHFGDAVDVARAWPFGHVSCASVNPERVAYVAQYTAKKMTNEDDERLDGRPPEFMICSRRPGIGLSDEVIDYLASMYRTDRGLVYLGEAGDISAQVRIGGRKWPIGYTLGQKIRARLDLPEKQKDRPPKEPYWQPDEILWSRWKFSGRKQKMVPVPESDEDKVPLLGTPERIRRAQEWDRKAQRLMKDHGKL